MIFNKKIVVEVRIFFWSEIQRCNQQSGPVHGDMNPAFACDPG